MVPSIDCPLYDGQQPIHVDITVEGVKEGCAVISDYTYSNDPIPFIKINIDIDMSRLILDSDQPVKKRIENDI